MWVDQDKDSVYIYAVDQFNVRFISACFCKSRLKKCFTIFTHQLLLESVACSWSCSLSSQSEGLVWSVCALF